MVTRPAAPRPVWKVSRRRAYLSACTSPRWQSTRPACGGLRRSGTLWLQIKTGLLGASGACFAHSRNTAGGQPRSPAQSTCAEKPQCITLCSPAHSSPQRRKRKGTLKSTPRFQIQDAGNQQSPSGALKVSPQPGKSIRFLSQNGACARLVWLSG